MSSRRSSAASASARRPGDEDADVDGLGRVDVHRPRAAASAAVSVLESRTNRAAGDGAPRVDVDLPVGYQAVQALHVLNRLHGVVVVVAAHRYGVGVPLA